MGRRQRARPGRRTSRNLPFLRLFARAAGNHSWVRRDGGRFGLFCGLWHAAGGNRPAHNANGLSGGWNAKTGERQLDVRERWVGRYGIQPHAGKFATGGLYVCGKIGGRSDLCRWIGVAYRRSAFFAFDHAPERKSESQILLYGWQDRTFPPIRSIRARISP